MKWLLGTVLIWSAAYILDSGLLAYTAYVLMGLLIVSRLLAMGWVKGLEAKRTCLSLAPRSENRDLEQAELLAEVGDTIVVRIRLENPGWLAVPWALIEDLLPTELIESRFPRLKLKGKRTKICRIPARGEVILRYQFECLTRGYYQIGPLVVEYGDLWGLHRQYRLLTEPKYLLVYPRIVPLEGYELASRRPIGDVRLTHRLYEDPTRIAGVRAYEPGDPINRVHWKATARTGELHCKITEPSTLSGATLILDFHKNGYHQRGEPHRSELAVVTAASMANAVLEIGQQIGLVTNAGDAADRLRLEQWEAEQQTRATAHRIVELKEQSDRLEPLRVETRRGAEQMARIREVLARVELTNSLSFAQLIEEAGSRLPRDATVVAILPKVTVEAALTLGNLRRQGFAITVVLILFEREELERVHGMLLAEGVKDIRHLQSEEELPALCRNQIQRSSPYQLSYLT